MGKHCLQKSHKFWIESQMMLAKARLKKMNKQNADKIDFCTHTWNPISGCLHACPYCYMRRMEKRFPGTMKPAFHENRLLEPLKLRKPSIIFVGSSGDMFGEWVPEQQINQVLDVAANCPRHTFLFLTKNPNRYGEFRDRFTDNMWFGTTVDGEKRTKNNLADLEWSVDVKRRFVSFEPLLARVEPNLTNIQWVIVGANSNKGAAKPPQGWADVIIRKAIRCDIPVFLKNNYGYPIRIKEVPFENVPEWATGFKPISEWIFKNCTIYAGAM